MTGKEKLTRCYILNCHWPMFLGFAATKKPLGTVCVIVGGSKTDVLSKQAPTTAFNGHQLINLFFVSLIPLPTKTINFCLNHHPWLTHCTLQLTCTFVVSLHN